MCTSIPTLSFTVWYFEKACKTTVTSVLHYEEYMTQVKFGWLAMAQSSFHMRHWNRFPLN